MKCFAQKQIQPRKPVPSSLARANQATPGLWPAKVQPKPSVGGEAALDTEAAKRFEPRFGHDFAQVVQQGQSLGAPRVIRRQKAGPTSNPRDPKVVLKDPCFGDQVDGSKARCQFSNRQLIFVRIVKEHALRKCSRAIAAINMPGNEGTVKKKAREYFHLDMRLTEKTKRTLINTIKAVSDKLKDTPIECGTCQDEGCNRGLLAYVPPGRGLLVLCPPFFMDEIHKVHLTPKTLIHEAGHLAGVNTPSRDELYCHQGEVTKEDKCPVVDAIRNADAWAYFIDELSYTI